MIPLLGDPALREDCTIRPALHPAAAPDKSASVHLIDLDGRLVQAMAAGDRKALGLLYDRHVQCLLAVGVRMLGSRAEAEDLVHDVLLEAWKRAETYDPQRASVKTWLLLRLRSRALDRLRSARVSRHVSEDDARLANRSAPAGEEPGQGSDRARLGEKLGALPEAQRRVVELVYFDGLSAREAAERLGVPVGTIKSRLAAALDKLRRVLDIQVLPTGAEG